MFIPASDKLVHDYDVICSSKTFCDLDPIPTSLMCDKYDLDALLPTLTKIVNDSLNLHRIAVPPGFKIAVVKPLLKKTSQDPNE